MTPMNDGNSSTGYSNSRINIATPAQVSILLGWAKNELWNPGLHDAALFHATDASGFLVCCLDDEPVAGISLVRHTHEQAFLGLYLCLPQYRGKGLGIGLWNEAFKHIDKHTVGLDGVVDQQANYRKSGFVYHFGNQRFSGVPDIGALESGALDVGAQHVTDHAERQKTETSSADTHSSDTHSFQNRSSEKHSLEIRPAGTSDAAGLVGYDAQIGGFQRSAFLAAWLAPTDTRQMLIAMSKGQVVGALGIRQCAEGYKLGPWLANSDDIACQLIVNGSKITGSENVMIDIPDVNPVATRIAQSLALKPIFDTARMYKGDAPSIDTQRLFGVGTLELG